MTLKISEIKNAALQKLAYLKDKNNDGILQEKEFNLFKKEAAKQQNISDDDFNQAMGLYLSNPVSSEVKSDSLIKEVAPARNDKTIEVSTNDFDSPEEIESVVETLQDSGCNVEKISYSKDGKVVYKVQLGDSWASIAEKFGFTQKHATLKEAVSALKEMAGYGGNLYATDMPSQIQFTK